MTAVRLPDVYRYYPLSETIRYAERVLGTRSIEIHLRKVLRPVRRFGTVAGGVPAEVAA